MGPARPPVLRHSADPDGTIPQVDAAAGRLLCLETTLCAPQANGPRVPLASANVSVPFNPAGEVRRPTLQYLITNAQLLALEQRRTGDLRLETSRGAASCHRPPPAAPAGLRSPRTSASPRAGGASSSQGLAARSARRC